MKKDKASAKTGTTGKLGEKKAEKKTEKKTEKSGAALGDNGRLYFAILIAFLIGMLGIQTVNTYQKQLAYKKQEAALEEELKAQQKKSEDLVEYEQQTQSEEYIENTAREKLGMTYENEIVFREK